MSNELATIDEPTKALSLPDWLGALASRMGEVKWPGQPVRKYLAGASSLTLSQRAEAERRAAELRSALNPAGGEKARAVILSNLILSSGGAALTERGAAAKAEAYVEALDDIPAWAIASAVRAWRRGECGDRNYEFAPSSATLREICLGVTAPYHAALTSLEAVANAMTLERAMDETPIEQDLTIPRLKAV